MWATLGRDLPIGLICIARSISPELQEHAEDVERKVGKQQGKDDQRKPQPVKQTSTKTQKESSPNLQIKTNSRTKKKPANVPFFSFQCHTFLTTKQQQEL
jgi:hypothetical protein